MPGTIIAAPVTPANTPGGYILTFVFPMLLFIVIGTAVYLLLFRPHKVPGHRDMAYAGSAAPEAAAPEPESARAAAVAGGLPTAAGGGSGESQVEPAGAHLETAAEPGEAGPRAQASQDAPAAPQQTAGEGGATRLDDAAQQGEAAAGQPDTLSGQEHAGPGGPGSDTKDSE